MSSPPSLRANSPREQSVPPGIRRLIEEPVFRTVLDNGVTVILKEEAAHPVVSAQVWVRTGSIHEGESAGHGLSHFLEHLVFQGAGERSSEAINEEAQAMGAHLNAYTTFDRTVYYLDTPEEALDRALSLLGDLTLRAKLPEAQFTREREVILREIEMGMDDPDRMLSRHLFATAFRIHPYRHPIIGHRELFLQSSYDDVAGYYQRRYRPNRLVVVLVGAFCSGEALESIQRHFGKAPRGVESEPFIPPEPPQLARRKSRHGASINLTRGAAAFRLPQISHADTPALDLLAICLGHGHSSRLWKGLREERRLVHNVQASTWNPGREGLLWISYLCEPDKRKAVEEGIIETVEGLVEDPPDEDELGKARRQVISAEVNMRNTVAGQAGRLGLAEVTMGDLFFPPRYLEQLHRVDGASLAATATRWLNEGGLTLASLEPEAAARRTRNDIMRNPRPPMEPFQEETLPNGIRLIAQYDGRLPKISLRAAMLGGARFDPAGKAGLTALTSTLLTRDTTRRPAGEIDLTVERLGGRFSPFCGNNTCGIALEVLSPDFAEAFELVEDAFERPAFAEETFTRERESQLASIREDLDEPLTRGRRLLRERFFAGQTLASEPAGTLDTVAPLMASELPGQHERLYRGGNLVVSLAGDFEAATLDRVRERLSGWMPARGTASPRPNQGPAAAIVEELRLNREQAVLLLGLPDCGIADDCFLRGEILDELLSDMSGRLFTRVREELGLAYYVGASRLSGIHEGMFILYAGTSTDSIDQVAGIFQQEIANLREGKIQPEAVERCKTRLRAQRQSQFQSIGFRAMHSALNSLYGLPLNDWTSFGERLSRIETGDLEQHAEEYLNPERSVTIRVLPSEDAVVD